MAIREHMVKKILTATPYSEIFYIAPNNQQAKEIMWTSLYERLVKMNITFKAMISKHRFEFPGNRLIYIIGAEKISRIRGHALIQVYLDELAFFTTNLEEVWRAVRPTLSDRTGGAIMATTPNGKGTDAYDLYVQAKQKHNWSTHLWKTIDNPYISQHEINEAKRELDEKSFLQEYEAQWQSFVGLAYYNFDEATHVKTCSTITPNVPIHLAFDFNVNPTTLLISQYYDHKLHYKREYSYKNASTEIALENFIDDFKDYKQYTYKIRGDASGKNRASTTGKSDYYYIEQMLTKNNFNYQMEVMSKNPPIVDRVKYVNAWLKPYEGHARIVIDPSCKELIRDLSSQELNGRIPSDANNLGHKADAFGYDIHYQQVSGERKQQRTIQL